MGRASGSLLVFLHTSKRRNHLGVERIHGRTRHHRWDRWGGQVAVCWYFSIHPSGEIIWEWNVPMGGPGTIGGGGGAKPVGGGPVGGGPSGPAPKSSTQKKRIRCQLLSFR
eukprot:1191934-Prorocentrum_minimum.AAC.1